ncbi:MAG: hypothetical protein IT373_03715, partial [Polyangiaceae bacterium]|nr:hypothetical protein [Polyangiaceae bacterium]
QPAAKKGDRVVAIDTHIVLVPSPAGPVPTPMPLPFSGKLDDDLVDAVLVEGEPAAAKGSKAKNQPPHVAPGGTFQKAPSDTGTVDTASSKVFFADRAAARIGDTVKTCNDPTDAPNGLIVGHAKVLVG